MIVRSFFSALHKPFHHKIYLKQLTIFNYFSSSPPFQSLKSSPFAKQLGLQEQFRQIIKLQQKSESSKFRLYAFIFTMVFLACGTVAIATLLDQSMIKLMKYQLNNWMAEVGVGEKFDKEERENKHCRNLKEIFDKNFKDRSMIDDRFLQYLRQYIDERVNQVKRDNRANNAEKNLKLADDIVYILQSLVQKFQSVPEQKLAKKKKEIFSIIEKIIYFELNHENLQPKKVNPITTELTPTKHLKIEPNLSQKLSIFLLMKGDINQQILGMKYLQITNSKQSKFHFLSYFSSKQIDQICSRIHLNRSQYEKSLQIFSSSSVNTGTNEQVPDISRRIFKVKEQLLYSMDEVKQINEIKKAKLNYLEEMFCREVKNENKIK